MRIALLDNQNRGSWELEKAVNEMLDKLDVIDIKISTATSGDSENMNTITTIMVIYK